MKTIFTVLTVFSTLTAFADKIENVEYQLPTAISQDWELANKLEGKNGTTLVYKPKNSDAFEFFGVNSNPFPMESDAESLKQGLTKIFANAEIEVNTLETSDGSAFFEWSAASKDGQEKAHGWSRGFSTDDGSVLLTYQTENIAEIAKSSALWLPVLQNAKQIKLAE